MTLKRCVNIVEKYSRQINMQKRDSVLGHVQLSNDTKTTKIKAIRFYGIEDVYNMEVKDHHNYSVDGGLIIHNCIDATRYAFEADMRPASFSFD